MKDPRISLPLDANVTNNASEVMAARFEQRDDVSMIDYVGNLRGGVGW